MKKLLVFLCVMALTAGVFQTTVCEAGASETDSGAETAEMDESLPAKEDVSEDASYEMGSPAETAGEVDLTAPDPEIGFPDSISEARGALKEIVGDHDVAAVVYLADEYAVRATPSQEGEAVVTVFGGQTVYIQDITLDESGQAWAYVSLYVREKFYCGFIPRSNLACSDEDFLNWETEYGMNPDRKRTFRSYAAPTANTADIEQFPASYRTALTALKKAHPNWTFVKQTVNLNWSTVVENELTGDRNLVSGSSFGARWRNELYGQNWYQVSEATLEYYLDPRNWLDESHIFLFEQLTYNASYHTQSAVQSFLNNTFMKGNLPKSASGEPKTYAEAFVRAGKETQVSPFHLASRVYQEQGAGKSGLISGTYSGYTGLYNYFNVGASGKTDKEVIVNGLKHAKGEGWTTPYKAIKGGAEVIGANYIRKGQDTLYLEKFDVDASYNGLYSHQYMQNISAPHVEGRKIYEMYQSIKALNNTFVFKIPVYSGMPSSACREPSVNTSVLLSQPSGYTDTTVYIDGVACRSVKQGGKRLVTAPGTGAKTATMYKYDSSGVPTGMYVWMIGYNSTDKNLTTTAVSGLKDLLSYHGFSIRITGDTGIRCKTGISTKVRSSLTKSGISGYKLKEYGTLMMTKANTAKYPMVKGGQKVADALAYGTSGGKKIDNIFETTGGRHRYTMVLTKLPAAQYKTELVFRGYITLTKSGKDYTVYGPQVSKSMYGLATQIVNSGAYKKNSSEDKYLRNIISKAK